MDWFVGTLGYGPRYLVDEYGVLDTRYWVVQDPCVTIVSFLEFFVMCPLCYLWLELNMSYICESTVYNSHWKSPCITVITVNL
jgi:hypothetical protein